MIRALVVVLSMSSSCALLSKSEVPNRRYFSPEQRTSDVKPVAAASACELRLGRVTAGAFITERFMFRESAHEVGFYEDRLWTEKPDQYLKRELAHVLFEEQGLRSVVRGAGPTLDVEVISFEEVKGNSHQSRIEVAFSLSDERVVLLQQTLLVEKPIAEAKQGEEGSAVAQAMGDALREVVHELTSRVVADLGKVSPGIAACSAPGTLGLSRE